MRTPSLHLQNVEFVLPGEVAAVPVGHGRQLLCLSCGWYDCRSHSVHSVSDVDELVYCPAAHGLQLAALVSLKAGSDQLKDENWP